ncbi:Smr/MutS family protein [Spirochaetota bacterium]
MENNNINNDEKTVNPEIDGTLDLHNFRPNEVKSLINEYIQECLRKEIYSIRIIHGKGKGIMKTVVNSTLNKNEFVASYKLGSAGAGNWGATLVELKKIRTQDAK